MPFIIFALLFPPSFLSLLVVTQIRGHISDSSPSPLRFVPLLFYREKTTSALFLPSSTRVELLYLFFGQNICDSWYHYERKYNTRSVSDVNIKKKKADYIFGQSYTLFLKDWIMGVKPR